MKKQLQGIAIILFSIMLIVGFEELGWHYAYVLGNELDWTHIFMLIGTFGLLQVLIPSKKE